MNTLDYADYQQMLSLQLFQLREVLEKPLEF